MPIWQPLRPGLQNSRHASNCPRMRILPRSEGWSGWRWRGTAWR